MRGQVIVGAKRMQLHDEAVEAAVRLDPEGEQAPLVAAQLLGEFVHAPGVESIELARARARQLRQPRRRVRLAQLLVQMLKARVAWLEPRIGARVHAEVALEPDEVYGVCLQLARRSPLLRARHLHVAEDRAAHAMQPRECVRARNMRPKIARAPILAFSHS